MHPHHDPGGGNSLLLMDCINVISNGNRTEWSTIQGVIGRVISNWPSA